MSNYIKKRKDVEKMADTLRELGWSPSVGTISYDGEVRGYNLGVVVKIGDERLKWTPYERNAAVDFFSFANIASGVSKSLARKPEGFNWSVAGTDQVQLMPNKGEKADAFIERLRNNVPPQPAVPMTASTSKQMTLDLFDDVEARPAARPGLRM